MNITSMSAKLTQPFPSDKPAPAVPAKQTVLFLSDLDGTWLSSNADNRKTLDDGVRALQKEMAEKGVDLQFGYVTARPPERMMSEHLPTPNWTITYNGGQINQGIPCTTNKADEFVSRPALQSWINVHQSCHFSRKIALADGLNVAHQPEFKDLEVKSMGEVVHNPAADNCANAVSFCVGVDSIKAQPGDNLAIGKSQQVEAFADAIVHDLQGQGTTLLHSEPYSFHGKPYIVFDVNTPLANKGNAVDFLRRELNITTDHLILAGDGGNDLPMMKDPQGHDDGRRVIVVGKNTELREQASKLGHSILAEPDADCSLAVLAGLKAHLAEIVAA